MLMRQLNCWDSICLAQGRVWQRSGCPAFPSLSLSFVFVLAFVFVFSYVFVFLTFCQSLRRPWECVNAPFVLSCHIFLWLLLCDVIVFLRGWRICSNHICCLFLLSLSYANYGFSSWWKRLIRPATGTSRAAPSVAQHVTRSVGGCRCEKWEATNNQ